MNINVLNIFCMKNILILALLKIVFMLIIFIWDVNAVWTMNMSRIIIITQFNLTKIIILTIMVNPKSYVYTKINIIFIVIISKTKLCAIVSRIKIIMIF